LKEFAGTARQPAQHDRTGGVATAAGRIFVVGGAADGPGPGRFGLDSSEVFDPDTNTWRPLDALLPVARGALCAGHGPGNAIVSFGGFEPRNQSFIASNRVEALSISQL
jgi:N-acetylneuraminic acid mutarotase